MAWLGREEDDADPMVATAVANNTKISSAGENNKPPAVAYVTATPSSMASMGHEEDDGDPPSARFDIKVSYYVEDEGEPIALKQYTLDAATTNKWSQLEVSPATITTVATSPSSVARDGHQEDKDDPPVALFGFDPMATTSPRERAPNALTLVAEEAYYAATPSAIAKLGTEEDDGDPSVARRWRLVLSLGQTRTHLALVCKPDLE